MSASYVPKADELDLLRFVADRTQRRRLDALPEGAKPDPDFLAAVRMHGVLEKDIHDWGHEPLGPGFTNPNSEFYGKVRHPGIYHLIATLLYPDIGRGWLEYVANYRDSQRLQLSAEGLRQAERLLGPMNAVPAPKPEVVPGHHVVPLTQRPNPKAEEPPAKAEPQPEKRKRGRPPTKNKPQELRSKDVAATHPAKPEPAPVPGGA